MMFPTNLLVQLLLKWVQTFVHACMQKKLKVNLKKKYLYFNVPNYSNKME